MPGSSKLITLSHMCMLFLKYFYLFFSYVIVHLEQLSIRNNLSINVEQFDYEGRTICL
jgi:hypothetical protein